MKETKNGARWNLFFKNQVQINRRERKIEDSHLILFESASRKIKSEEESRIQMKFERCRPLCAFEQCIVMQCMFALKVRMQKCIFSLMDLVPQTLYVCLISGESLIYA